MTPTPKQVRSHFRRLSRLRYQLQRALDRAHEAEVIEYQDYKTQSPCQSLYETWERIKQTTEKSLAQALRDEIHREGDA